MAIWFQENFGKPQIGLPALAALFGLVVGASNGILVAFATGAICAGLIRATVSHLESQR
mgnify:FL=1